MDRNLLEGFFGELEGIYKEAASPLSTFRALGKSSKVGKLSGLGKRRYKSPRLTALKKPPPIKAPKTPKPVTQGNFRPGKTIAGRSYMAPKSVSGVKFKPWTVK